MEIPEKLKTKIHSQNGQVWDLGIRPEYMSLVSNDNRVLPTIIDPIYSIVSPKFGG